MNQKMTGHGNSVGRLHSVVVIAYSIPFKDTCLGTERGAHTDSFSGSRAPLSGGLMLPVLKFLRPDDISGSLTWTSIAIYLYAA
jgi:hypothetical protein